MQSSTSGPVAAIIHSKITAALAPTHFEIVNDSHKHASHSAMRGETSEETHFHLTVVSEHFEGKALIDRHRMVNELLEAELDKNQGGTVHALQIKAKTPAQWLKL